MLYTMTKAGGSFGTTAYNTFKDPIAIEEIQANAGIDIGGTLIGMHIKKVAVPVKMENNIIGQARVIFVRTERNLSEEEELIT